MPGSRGCLTAKVAVTASTVHPAFKHPKWLHNIHHPNIHHRLPLNKESSPTMGQLNSTLTVEPVQNQSPVPDHEAQQVAQDLVDKSSICTATCWASWSGTCSLHSPCLFPSLSSSSPNSPLPGAPSFYPSPHIHPTFPLSGGIGNHWVAE